MITVAHPYSFDDLKGDAYKRFRAEREAEDRPRCFSELGDPDAAFREFTDGERVELDVKHVFADQWNTVDGRRIFDWYEPVVPTGRSVRSGGKGYYLEQTPEMREVRRNTLTCGYCGHHKQAAQGYDFCPDCLGSEYLKRTELHLLRLKPAGLHFPEREPLTDAEAGKLLPLYREAQGIGEENRNAEARRKLTARYKRALEKADQAKADALHEYDVRNWLMDQGFGREILSNVIYYSHTERWKFGWLRPLTDDERSQLLELLTEAPFDYDIKAAK